MNGKSTKNSGRVAGSRRAFDIAAVLVLAPLLAIPALVVALLVFLDSPGPVIYRASRIGMNGKPFLMLKFRTMRNGSAGAAVSASSDPRVTPLGRLLRASRLDELPQVWNVLRGEMSVVGPRPEVEEFVAAFRKDYEQILAVPPGLTGPSQVRFATAEARMLADSDDPAGHYIRAVLPGKVALDLDYARTHTVGGDVAIIGQTLLLPVRQLAGSLSQLAETHRPHRSAYALSAGIGTVLLVAFVVASSSGN
jgi:lipopolysaccharide/colanic/teichoic acid biosynthesis glycosyltransferase